MRWVYDDLAAVRHLGKRAQMTTKAYVSLEAARRRMTERLAQIRLERFGNDGGGEHLLRALCSGDESSSTPDGSKR
jgi:hypothetical protein